jgi:hypothetical protein
VVANPKPETPLITLVPLGQAIDVPSEDADVCGPAGCVWPGRDTTGD